MPQYQFVETFEVNESGGVVIGRSDEATRYQPDVDLAACDGREKGVSRRHAAVVQFRDSLHLIDLHSVNGTFLNDQVLPPDQPYPLGTESNIRLGTLDLKMIIG
ncbi:MAG: FHA domain-containing protein [Anaerolineae bacterium]|nr:FHA domain-containing protein [Anaerolineae bacterium]NUQ03472.1 FHA domain-containing protein [Anaerolineae bacterium]